MIKQQLGFTLLELMLAIVLGLLVVAAAISLFISAGRSVNLQTGMGELQQNANFGLAMMARDVRHANLNTASNQKINKTILGSGVIFTKNNVGLSTSAIEINKYVTLAAQNRDGSKDGESDQLTIQYMPQYEVTENLTPKKDADGNPVVNAGTPVMVKTIKSSTKTYDCEGALIASDVSDEGDSSIVLTESKPVIVQRYFIQKLPDSYQTTGSAIRYGLYCDAGKYTSNSNEIDGLGGNAQLVMQDIEAFKIRFGVKNASGFKYVTIGQYDGTSQIISAELGILARSSGSIGSNQSLNTKYEYKVAGQNVVLDNENNEYEKYLRQVVTQVVGFRNTLGASL